MKDGDDVKKRINNLLVQISEAGRILDNNKDPKGTLRLFIAPEWYFRPSKRSAIAYQLKDMKLIVKTIVDLSHQLPTTLILPGTVYWGQKERGETRVFNCAPAVFNGKLLSLHHKLDNADTFSSRKEEVWGLRSAGKLDRKLGMPTRIAYKFGGRTSGNT
ncbi:hypothetical protein BH23ACT12_BH23ACT12_19660 [soil metagenome]